MWLVVASDSLVTLLRWLARLISPSAPIPDGRSYPKLVAVPMESDKTSQPRSKPFSLPYLGPALDRLVLLDLFSNNPPPPLIPLGPRSVPLSQFFLEPLEPGEKDRS